MKQASYSTTSRGGQPNATFPVHDAELLAKTRKDALADGTIPTPRDKQVHQQDKPEPELEEFDRVPTETWLELYQNLHTTYTQFGRRLDPNPPAANIHKAETGAPWRREGERRVAEANRRAQPELERRRAVGLARQTSSGLWNAFGIHYDYSDLAPILSDAIKLKEKAARQDKEYRRKLEEVLARRKAAEEKQRERIAAEVEHEERERVKQEKLEKIKQEQQEQQKQKTAKKKPASGKSKKSNESAQETQPQEVELSQEDEASIQSAVEQALKQIDLSDEYPAPKQPELTQKESEYIQLADAAFKFGKLYMHWVVALTSCRHSVICRFAQSQNLVETEGKR
eukprot:gb/GECG01003401.1/.p1 GENE.gb/GECG01003401.1/~~gb/GECG01003401.1/.p1  ORF type:complete len:341 (+),score=65.89 gb/GECG01003401.1/:1-1023(+)